MRSRRSIVVGLTMALAAGLAGSLAVLPATAEEDEAASGVDWGACPEDAPETASLECATVAVPLDYDDPDGETIDVMISRLASTNPEQRRGVLMLNPGGPAAGLGMPADLVGLGIPNSVLESYDLIGMDPRGLGHSTPVSCGFTVEQGYRGNLPPYAPDDAAVLEQAEAAEAVAAQCAENDTDGLMEHVSTANIARDMDVIREALGEEKLNYFGLSYGTALGAAYDSLFPENGDRIVIDSNVGAAGGSLEMQRLWGRGFEDAFPDFAAWAAERHGAYGLGETPEEVERHYFELAERLDEEPVMEVDGALFRFAVFVGLYAEASYGQTAQLWQSLVEGDEAAVGTQVEELELQAPAEDAQAPSELSPNDNAWAGYLAVVCNDSEWPEDIAVYREAVAADREEYPMFGAVGANVSPCAFWHHEPDEVVEIDDEGPQNVLVVQNLRDPATPHVAGVQAREEFGDRARLVAVDGSGHGAYVYGDNPCAMNTVTAFLVDGEMPEDDVFCEASTASGLDLDEEAEQLRAETLESLNR